MSLKSQLSKPKPDKIVPMSSQQQSSPIGNSLEPLKRLRRRILKRVWEEPVKPIAWHNLPWWIYQTAKTDTKHYHQKHRPFTTKRLIGILRPNLKDPIFIIGSPRSGTTFLGDCLAQIPEISYHFEPVLIKAASRYVYTKEWESDRASGFYRRVYAWLMRFQKDGDLRLAEKTPRNSFIIPFLAQTFPDAKFIHIIRDGRDVAVSLAQKPWYSNELNGSIMREPGGYLCGSSARFWVEPERRKEFETTNNIHRCIWIWRKYTEAASEGINQLPLEQKYELRYENLVANPQIEATRILNFLDIEKQSSRSIFQQHLVDKAKVDSIGKWQSELDDNSLEQIEKEAGSWLKQWGYSC